MSEQSDASFAEEAYQQALALVRKCLTPAGFVASSSDIENYKRVWARDGVITGLAALASGNGELIEGMRRTLTTLLEQQGPHGEIPSNVSLDGKAVSYGRLVGRVDAGLWWVIGLCAYLRHAGQQHILSLYKEGVARALYLAECWEYNNRGLIYTPIAGNWADEYILQGYVLSDQLLYMLALSCAGATFQVEAWQAKAAALQQTLALNYWPRRVLLDDPHVYHPYAYRHEIEHGETQHWLAAFSPAGYARTFDGLAHALAMLVGLGDDEQWQRAENYAQSLEVQTASRLLPAFWPVIHPQDAQWAALAANHLYGEIKNQPYQYHNGGLWPMVSGFYVLGLLHYNMRERAMVLLDALNHANAQSRSEHAWEFAEYHHGQTGEPLGTPYLAWSAAATIIAHQALRNGFSPFS